MSTTKYSDGEIFSPFIPPTPRSCSFFPFYTFHAVLCFSFVAVMLFGFLQKIVLSKLEVISSLAHTHARTDTYTHAKAQKQRRVDSCGG